jgi:alpha-1,6-mannosyltransferase
MAFPRAVARWASGRGVRVAMLCHSDLSLAARGLPAPVARPAGAALAWVQRRGTGAPDLVFVTSRASEERLGPLARGRVERLPLGIDLDVFTRARPSRELRRALAPAWAPLLLYAGRLSSEKHVDLLPEALAHVPAARLALAGAGPAEKALRRQAARRGVADRMLFLGHIADRDRLAALMATADCFVHPNPDEPYGLAPLEALSARCRVVAPDGAGRPSAAAERCSSLRPTPARSPTGCGRRSSARGPGPPWPISRGSARSPASGACTAS